MNPLAYQVLSYFLSSNELILISSILNDKIMIHLLQTTYSKTNNPITTNTTSMMESNALIVLPGYSVVINKVNMLQKDVLLGVPGSGNLLKYLTEFFTPSVLFKNLILPDTRKDLCKFYIEKLIRPKALIHRVKDRKITARIQELEQRTRGIGGGNGVTSRINNQDELWTPLISPKPASSALLLLFPSTGSGTNGGEDREIEAEEHITTSSANSNGSSVGDGSEPSIIFATVGNSYEGMTCMHINAEINQVVTGYMDGIVRCWRLDEHQNHTNSHSHRSWFGHQLPTNNNNNSDDYDYWGLSEVLPKPSISNSNSNNMRYDDEKVYYPPHKLSRTNNTNGTNSGTNSNSDYPRIELIGHTKPIYAITQHESNSISGGSRYVYSTSADETIRLWDLSISQCVQKYKTNATIAWSIACNPLEYHFLTGNSDATVTLYSIDRITPLRMFTGHSSDITCLTWHPNYTLFSSGSDDRTVRLWDLRTTECVRIWQDIGYPVTAMNIAPTGNLILVGTDQGTIGMYDIRSTRKLGMFYGHSDVIHSLAFSPNCLQFVSGSNDCTIKVWDCDKAYAGTMSCTTSIAPLPYRPQQQQQQQQQMQQQQQQVPMQQPIQTTNGANGANGNSGNNYDPQHNALLQSMKQHCPIFSSRHSFMTKATPVYTVNYTNTNLIYAGGPFTMQAATSGSGGGSNASLLATGVTGKILIIIQ